MDNRYLFLTERDFVRVMALQPGPALRAELERAIVVEPDDLPLRDRLADEDVHPSNIQTDPPPAHTRG